MHTRLTLILLLTFSFCAALIAKPVEDFSAAIIKGKNLIEKGVQKNDEKLLVDARATFERLTQNDEMQWLTHYYVGLADYRLAIYYQSQNNSKQLIKYLDDGIQHIYTSLEKNEEFADAHGLLSALLGQKIGTDPSLGMTLGMEAMTAMNDAITYGKDNPRVALFSAISAYYTPEQYGGSKTRAMQEMSRAIGLFENENLEDKRLPDWGHDEALVWHARFNLEAVNLDTAKQSIEKALKLSPENAFAKYVQQELKKKLSEK
ncbi:MAG: hypothetical protein ACE5G1_09145 [bacterium]